LGQSVALTDPEPPNEPSTYEQHLFFASDPEWQCSVPELFYGGLQGMPEHCQNRVLMSFDRSLDQIFGWHPSSLKRIEKQVDSTPGYYRSSHGNLGLAQRTMAKGLTISYKFASGGSKDGNDQNCDDSGDVIRVCTSVPQLPSDLSFRLSAAMADLDIVRARLSNFLRNFSAVQPRSQSRASDIADCEVNVLDKLKTLKDFDLKGFLDYLRLGAKINYGPTSTINAFVALNGNNFQMADFNLTVGQVYLSARAPNNPKARLGVITSFSLSENGLTMFLGENSFSSPALMFHEALHGYGAHLNNGKAGNYGDRQLLDLFGLSVTGPSDQITAYIEKHCGGFLGKRGFFNVVSH